MGDLNIRLAQPEDFLTLSSFLSFQSRIHRHLDWKSPLDWLGTQPFLIAERNGRLEALMACPPDPPHVAWVRLFACTHDFSITQAWNALIARGREMLSQNPHCQLVALGLQQWFENLLIHSGFTLRQSIVVLEWEGHLPAARSLPDGTVIRLMQKGDLEGVTEVDGETFESIWQNSLEALRLAYEQSPVSTVAVREGRIVGYQISTSYPFSGHLARLAVRPEFQRMNIAYGLVCDLLERFKRQGVSRVTVNTQDNNLASLSLYDSIGFSRTGEEFSVYQIPLSNPK
jgi:ribosomal protein S18 acetylase RimI-like enzyme